MYRYGCRRAERVPLSILPTNGSKRTRQADPAFRPREVLYDYIHGGASFAPEAVARLHRFTPRWLSWVSWGTAFGVLRVGVEDRGEDRSFRPTRRSDHVIRRPPGIVSTTERARLTGLSKTFPGRVAAIARIPGNAKRVSDGKGTCSSPGADSYSAEAIALQSAKYGRAR